MAQKRFDAKLIHTHTFPLEEVPKAFKYFRERIEDAIKVVIKVPCQVAVSRSKDEEGNTMENFSIYRFMRLGIVHFKAFPEVSRGEGPIVETLRKIVEDDFWTAVEVGWMKDVKVRNEARRLLETSHMTVCYANQPRMFSNKLDLNAFDPKERKKAISMMKNGINEAFDLGASCIRVFSGKHPGEEKKEEAKKILIDSLKEVCRYTNEQGPMEIYMKVFDYDIDKSFLIGHFKDAADVATEVHKEFKNFGVLADLSHFPLLRETPEEAIPLVKRFPMHFHIGNCLVPRQETPDLRGPPAPFRDARRGDRHPAGQGLLQAPARFEALEPGEEARAQRRGEAAACRGHLRGGHREHEAGDQGGLGPGVASACSEIKKNNHEREEYHVEQRRNVAGSRWPFFFSVLFSWPCCISGIGRCRGRSGLRNRWNSINPFGAGGAADVQARKLAEIISRDLGQPMVVRNVTGAGGAIAYNEVQRAKPDGYTMIWYSGAINTLAARKQIKFDYQAFEPIAGIGIETIAIAVNKTAPWKDFKEFVAYIKQNPGKVRSGIPGWGA